MLLRTFLSQKEKKKNLNLKILSLDNFPIPIFTFVFKPLGIMDKNEANGDGFGALGLTGR